MAKLAYCVGFVLLAPFLVLMVSVAYARDYWVHMAELRRYGGR